MRRDIRELTLEDLPEIKEEASKYINKIAAGSGITNAIPLPGIGDGYDIVMMIRAMKKIAEKYGLDDDQIDSYPEELRIVIYEAGKKTATKLIGKKLTEAAVKKLLQKMGARFATKSVLRFVPIVGQVVSGAISAGLMKAMLEDWNNDCYKTAEAAIKHLQSKKEQKQTGIEDSSEGVYRPYG
jgi:hypothetical protein